MPVKTRDAVATAGKYLTFELAEEYYGLEILRVQEIVGLLPVTRVPRMPEFVAGVVNLRGRIIPVVDLRMSFGLPAADELERTCIIVVRVEHDSGSTSVMGAIVDEVSDVVALTAEQVEATPEFGAVVDTSFIKGVGRSEDRVVLLLDIDRVWSGSEIEIIGRATSSAGAEIAGAEGEDDV